MTVVSPKRFVPPEILSKAKGNISHISDGSGKWIVIKKYNGKLKKHIESFIGKKGQMRLTFSDREIIMKINNDRDSFSIIN